MVENANALVYSYQSGSNTWKERYRITYCEAKYDSSGNITVLDMIYEENYPNSNHTDDYVEFKVAYKFWYATGSGGYCRVQRIVNVDNS